jgi:KipI family sensor histidine kinase inhibitor
MRLVHLVPVGRDAVLIQVGSPHEAVSLATWARERSLATEVVPGAETVLLDGLLDRLADRESLAAVLDGWRPVSVGPGALVELSVTYDGPDLDDVAECWGCAVEQVVARHQETELVSAFCGFAPGFAYLTGLDERLHVPRRESPRKRVPAGAVAVADVFTAVYPRESPGGWQLVGRTAEPLWDVERDPPARLVPGTRVRFVAA